MNSLQLKLCDIQGRLFELSAEKKYNSTAFIKAFMTSETAKALDSEYNRMQWAGEEYLLEEVVADAGDMLSTDGEIFSKDILYWIGYIYRYWHLLAMERSPIKDIEIKHILKNALTDDINSREVYMKGIDHSYYYEGYTTFKTEEL